MECPGRILIRDGLHYDPRYARIPETENIGGAG
jgi:hypothetical protein